MDWFNEVNLMAPSCAGQLQSLMAGCDSAVHWPRVIGADDIVEVAKQIKQSGASSLGEFMFRGETLLQYSKNGSVLIPHELLRSQKRHLPDPKCNNEIRGGGTTNKEAPLWAPSGKNLTTPEKYIEIATLVRPDIIQLMNDYDLDRVKPNTKKRLEKARKRSEDWISKQLLGLTKDVKLLLPCLVLSDKYQQAAHLDFIRKVLNDNDNVVGLSFNGETRSDINTARMELLAHYCTELAAHKKPIVCFDLSTPLEIVEGLKLGVTGFGGQYALEMAQEHKAVILPNAEYPDRKMVAIDVTEKEKHRMNKNTISPDSIVKLSVGYIAHLCKVGEILETILLTQHNLDQMDKFLAHAKTATHDYDKLRGLVE